MKTSFILAGAGILVVAVLGLVLAQYLSADNPEAAPPAQTLKPWIDVSSGKAFSFSATGEVLSELKSGDEIARGAVVGTGASVFGPPRAPKHVAPFAWGGDTDERLDVERFLDMAERILPRRDVTVDSAMRDHLAALHARLVG